MIKAAVKIVQITPTGEELRLGRADFEPLAGELAFAIAERWVTSVETLSAIVPHNVIRYNEWVDWNPDRTAQYQWDGANGDHTRVVIWEYEK